jgi:predicted secreted protein
VGEGTCLSKIVLVSAALVLTAAAASRAVPKKLTTNVLQMCEEAHMSVSNIFNVFVRHLDGTTNAYRGDNGNIVVYETRAEAEVAAAELAAANKNPNISFTVIEFEPTD